MSLVLAPIQLGSLSWDWSRTCIWGVVNVTPDSFYDGGRHFNTEAAVTHGIALAEQGADVLDVGGESTRPLARIIPEEEELDRVLPVIQGLAERCATPISVDTYKAKVAREAVNAGASMINDVSGLKLDPEMPSTVASLKTPVVIGHLRGQPATMLEDIQFIDVVEEVEQELRDSIRLGIKAGIAPEHIWTDPGIGFGKTAEQSLALLRAMTMLRENLGYPMMIGPSRKSFIGAVTGQPPEDRLMGTCAAVTAAVMSGADAVRIHDVGQLAPAIQIAEAIRGQQR